MTSHNEADLEELERHLRELQHKLQERKIAQWHRRVSFGDLISERIDNARQCGFGEAHDMLRQCIRAW